jgi:hypothetical protein
MTKLAAIIGGVVLLAGAALAGTLTSLGGSTNTPAGNSIPPPLTATLQQDDRGGEIERRGREAEPAERENEDEAAEDLRGPCDEAEHANDPRCTGAPAARDDDEAGEAERTDDRSGHDGSGQDRSGHGGDDD